MAHQVGASPRLPSHEILLASTPKMPAFFTGDRVSDYYLALAQPLLLLLLLLVLAVRVPALLRSAGGADRAPMALRAVNVVGAALLFAGTVAELVLDPEQDRMDVPPGYSQGAVRGLYLACGSCGAAAWACVLGLALFEARCGRNAGRSTRLWLMLSALLACLRFASDVERLATGSAPLDGVARARLGVFAVSAVVGLVALCQPDSPSDAAYAQPAAPSPSAGPASPGRGSGHGARLLPPAEEAAPAEGAEGKRNKEATASFWSRFTFSWLSGILWLGSRRALEQSDLFSLQTADATAHTSAEMAAAWRWEQRRRPGRGVFLRAFHRAYGPYFWTTGLFQVANTSLMFANPLLINTLVRYLSGEQPLSPTAAVVCALGMFVANSAKSLALGQYFFRGFRLGLRAKSAIGQLVFAKARCAETRRDAPR